MASEKTLECLARHIGRVQYGNVIGNTSAALNAVANARKAYRSGKTIDIMFALNDLSAIKTRPGLSIVQQTENSTYDNH